VREAVAGLHLCRSPTPAFEEKIKGSIGSRETGGPGGPSPEQYPSGGAGENQDLRVDLHCAMGRYVKKRGFLRVNIK